jgi:hypothetical protein
MTIIDPNYCHSRILSNHLTLKGGSLPIALKWPSRGGSFGGSRPETGLKPEILGSQEPNFQWGCEARFWGVQGPKPNFGGSREIQAAPFRGRGARFWRSRGVQTAGWTPWTKRFWTQELTVSTPGPQNDFGLKWPFGPPGPPKWPLGPRFTPPPPLKVIIRWSRFAKTRQVFQPLPTAEHFWQNTTKSDIQCDNNKPQSIRVFS